MSRILLLACVVFNAHVLRAEEKSPPVYETPAAAFEAYVKAASKADWKTSWACLTPQLQDLQATESLFGLGMHDPDYEKKYLKPDIQPPAAPIKDENERQKVLLSMIRDKFVVYAAACDFQKKNLDPVDWQQPLREVVIDKDRAQGVVTRQISHLERRNGQPAVKVLTPWGSPVYFQKTDKGWLLDAPTPEEAKRYARKFGEPTE